MSGNLVDPFTATKIQFEYGGPSESDHPVTAENTGGAAPLQKEPAKPEKTAGPKKEPAPKPKLKPKPKPKADTDPRFPYCKDLPAGYGPYVRGVDPEYDWYTDRDKDGVVCE